MIVVVGCWTDLQDRNNEKGLPELSLEGSPTVKLVKEVYIGREKEFIA